MNLLLLHADDRLEGSRYRVTGRHFSHIGQHLKLDVGDTLRAGLIDGDLGQATISARHADHLIVDFIATAPPPVPADITLLLALPRPKMLKRIVLEATTLGVKKIVLLNSYKVEKSYWSTPELHANLLREKLLLGLEQAGDTCLPSLQLEKRFKPFVEDRLPALAANRLGLLAHPRGNRPMPTNLQAPAILAIGPEGGWTDYECESLMAAGFEAVSMGSRVLRVETAVAALLGRLLAL